MTSNTVSFENLQSKSRLNRWANLQHYYTGISAPGFVCVSPGPYVASKHAQQTEVLLIYISYIIDNLQWNNITGGSCDDMDQLSKVVPEECIKRMEK